MPKHPGQWDMAVIALGDTSSAVVSQRILPKPKAPEVYEIHSIRCTMSVGGTGSLACTAIAEEAAPTGLGNNDTTVMQIRETTSGMSTWFHWTRSNQLIVPQPTIYMPPQFYWESEMHAWLQNGAGATIYAMFTVIFRTVRLSVSDFVYELDSVLPGTGRKDRIQV